jgi:hypothetical protein
MLYTAVLPHMLSSRLLSSMLDTGDTSYTVQNSWQSNAVFTVFLTEVNHCSTDNFLWLPLPACYTHTSSYFGWLIM